MDSFITVFPSDFPLDDVRTIGSRLTELDCLVPGFIPPRAGLLNLNALSYAHHSEGLETVVLVDRNLASRMAKLASDGASRLWDRPTEVAVNLMAFAQSMNIDIEPGLAFHELAHGSGNGIATSELGWFRAADRGAALKWIDVAMRRSATVDLGPAEAPEERNMSAPPLRWTRNYIVALKTMKLALLGGRA